MDDPAIMCDEIVESYHEYTEAKSYDEKKFYPKIAWESN